MKRALVLLFLTGACIAGFFYFRGTAISQLPYANAPLPFFLSFSGLLLSIVVLGLLAAFLYRHELGHGLRGLHRSIFAPVINEERRNSQLLANKIESTEHRMSTTEQALEKFAAAIGDYATHLSSHTSAIQGLAEASQELKLSAAEQNRVLAYLLKDTEEAGVLWQAPPVEQEPETKDEPPVQQASTIEREEPEPEKPATVVRIHKPYQKPGIFDKPMPQGCALSRETRAKKALAAQKEISYALHNLQSKLDRV